MIGQIRHELRKLRRATLQQGRGYLGRLGLADITAKVLGREGATILVYHSVADPETGHWIDPANQISIGRFRSHMNFLATHRSILSLSEIVRRLVNQEPIPRNTVAITFDDGYLDAIQHAAPILKSLNMPATFYLPTRYTDEGLPQWIDSLYSAFARRTRHSLSIDDESLLDVSQTGPYNLRKAYAKCACRLRAAGMTERLALLAQIVDQLAPTAIPPRLTATWDEIRSCAEQCPLLDFGGHTREHIDLLTADEATTKEQMGGSMADVAEKLQRPVCHFSFPYGRALPWHSTWMKEQGWASGVADGDAMLIGNNHDRYRLPRLDTNMATAELAFCTSGLNGS